MLFFWRARSLLECPFVLLGYSRKNPHPPTDGTLEILAGGGVEGSGNPSRRGGLDLQNSSLGVIFTVIF